MVDMLFKPFDEESLSQWREQQEQMRSSLKAAFKMGYRISQEGLGQWTVDRPDGANLGYLFEDDVDARDAMLIDFHAMRVKSDFVEEELSAEYVRQAIEEGFRVVPMRLSEEGALSQGLGVILPSGQGVPDVVFDSPVDAWAYIVDISGYMEYHGMDSVDFLAERSEQTPR